ncbi:hypothetical protein OIO90_006179 [Microbotryomycetes sp. JL221]|nr:hypothetical protein OIO90_006179 [Microbotryomycetes sp. JL221]
MDQRVSRNKALDHHVKTRVGPDTILLQIDGAQRLAIDNPTLFDQEACTYTFDIQLTNPGMFWVNMTLVNQDFQGIKDVDAVPKSRPQPAMTLTPIVHEPVAFDICATHCSSHVPRRDSPLAQVDLHSGKASHHEPPFPPTCRISTPYTGSYVLNNLLNVLYPKQALALSEPGRASHTRATNGFYTFIPNSCIWPHSHLRDTNQDNQELILSKCIDKKKRTDRKGWKSLTIGDSHARTVHDVAIARLKGDRGTVMTSPKGSKKETIRDVYMEYVWDPYLETKPTCERFGGFDAITLSFGTHHLRQDCSHTTTYLSHLINVIHEWSTVLESCRTSHPRFIIMTIPPMHPQLHNHDCRTDPRISLWNRLLKQVIKHPQHRKLSDVEPLDLLLNDISMNNQTIARAKQIMSVARDQPSWKVVDFNTLSKPIAIDTDLIDGVHFLKTDAIDVVTDDWLGRTGLCPY